MRDTILTGVRGDLARHNPVEGADHGEHGTVGADGCGNCGEEFAEASVLSGLAGGEIEPGGAATLCRTILQACGSVSETPARTCGAHGRTATGIDPREPGGGGESDRAAPEAQAGFCGRRGSR